MSITCIGLAKANKRERHMHIALKTQQAFAHLKIANAFEKEYLWGNQSVCK